MLCNGWYGTCKTTEDADADTAHCLERAGQDVGVRGRIDLVSVIHELFVLLVRDKNLEVLQRGRRDQLLRSR
jgi:hypothetical protein